MDFYVVFFLEFIIDESFYDRGFARTAVTK